MFWIFKFTQISKMLSTHTNLRWNTLLLCSILQVHQFSTTFNPIVSCFIFENSHEFEFSKEWPNIKIREFFLFKTRLNWLRQKFYKKYSNFWKGFWHVEKQIELYLVCSFFGDMQCSIWSQREFFMTESVINQTSETRLSKYILKFSLIIEVLKYFFDPFFGSYHTLISIMDADIEEFQTWLKHIMQMEFVNASSYEKKKVIVSF